MMLLEKNIPLSNSPGPTAAEENQNLGKPRYLVLAGAARINNCAHSEEDRAHAPRCGFVHQRQGETATTKLKGRFTRPRLSIKNLPPTRATLVTANYHASDGSRLNFSRTLRVNLA
mmetsp:Transcript_50802/g.61152  ORF Transcript_50802/g.61152 Transcript_50802/m.61152 type:complete len:116 (-) Transcript_50802:144-491(-)